VEYWDVNFIRVWNNTADDFGDGAITKIFTNLPEGTSIGNPSFSKTNRNIVCFDLFNEIDETYVIIAANLSTGDTRAIYENNTLGFPNYSNDDSFLVFDALDENGTPVIGQIPLAENKLEAAGEPEFPYVNAQWTTWFSQGERVINSAENNLTTFELLVPGGTIPGIIEDQEISLSVSDTVDITRLVANFKQSEKASVFVGDFRQISGITSNDFSKAVVYTVVAENGDTQDYSIAITIEETPDPEPVGIADEIAKMLLVYPNPFEQEIFLGESLIGKPVKLSMFNILGQSIPLEKRDESFKVTPPLSPGMYLLTIQNGSYNKTIRLIKE
jgi:hypothetical protein